METLLKDLLNKKHETDSVFITHFRSIVGDEQQYEVQFNIIGTNHLVNVSMSEILEFMYEGKFL